MAFQNFFKIKILKKFNLIFPLPKFTLIKRRFNFELFFSLIIASKNEEKDIYLSLDSSLKQNIKIMKLLL